MLVRIKLVYTAKRLHEIGNSAVCILLYSLPLALSRKHPTRALTVYLVSSIAPNAATPGAVVTHGPTWVRSASHVTLWCTPTPSNHYEDQIHVRSDACRQRVYLWHSHNWSDWLL